MAEELAVLLDSEDVHFIELAGEVSASASSAIISCPLASIVFSSCRRFPVDFEALDRAAGDSWAFGAVFARVPS